MSRRRPKTRAPRTTPVVTVQRHHIPSSERPREIQAHPGIRQDAPQPGLTIAEQARRGLGPAIQSVRKARQARERRRREAIRRGNNGRPSRAKARNRAGRNVSRRAGGPAGPSSTESNSLKAAIDKARKWQQDLAKKNHILEARARKARGEATRALLKSLGHLPKNSVQISGGAMSTSLFQSSTGEQRDTDTEAPRFRVERRDITPRKEPPASSADNLRDKNVRGPTSSR